ncbi:MAG: protein containing prepilin-type N- cleavage/methylation domain protein, partial [Sulfurimonas sp.]|nr:protein containing prepilin-type N- cleavage/methylation domain protein [Sulfurimonas sp.]
ALNTLIGILSHGSGTGINNAALYFIGSDSNVRTGYGWNGAITDQSSAMHPIIANGIDGFSSSIVGVDFSGVDVFEYYQLAWTAYAVVHDENSGDLTLHYDYQPWRGDTYLLKQDGTQTKNELLMQNVDTFRFKAVGSVVKIQVCVETDLVEEYSLCKEKTIF